jgi:hypothetical protein
LDNKNLFGEALSIRINRRKRGRLKKYTFKDKKPEKVNQEKIPGRKCKKL